MTAIILWVLIGWIVLSVLLMIGNIGKPRTPLTPAVAVTSIVVWGALIVFGLIPAAVALS